MTTITQFSFLMSSPKYLKFYCFDVAISLLLKTILFLATAGKTSWVVRHNLEFGKKNLIVVIPGKRVSVETRLLHYAKELVLVNFAVTIPVSLVNHFLKYMN